MKTETARFRAKFLFLATCSGFPDRPYNSNNPKVFQLLLKKCVTDMTELKASDGKLYILAIFDCYDLAVLGLAMDTNRKADCVNKH